MKKFFLILAFVFTFSSVTAHACIPLPGGAGLPGGIEIDDVLDVVGQACSTVGRNCDDQIDMIENVCQQMELVMMGVNMLNDGIALGPDMIGTTTQVWDPDLGQMVTISNQQPFQAINEQFSIMGDEVANLGGILGNVSSFGSVNMPGVDMGIGGFTPPGLGSLPGVPDVPDVDIGDVLAGDIFDGLPALPQGFDNAGGSGLPPFDGEEYGSSGEPAIGTHGGGSEPDPSTSFGSEDDESAAAVNAADGVGIDPDEINASIDRIEDSAQEIDNIINAMFCITVTRETGGDSGDTYEEELCGADASAYLSSTGGSSGGGGTGGGTLPPLYDQAFIDSLMADNPGGLVECENGSVTLVTDSGGSSVLPSDYTPVEYPELCDQLASDLVQQELDANPGWVPDCQPGGIDTVSLDPDGDGVFEDFDVSYEGGIAGYIDEFGDPQSLPFDNGTLSDGSPRPFPHDLCP